jgi:hypothetical protein
MGKKNTPKQAPEEHEIDIFKELSEDDSVDVLITSEESIIVTLFDDETSPETEEEDDFETNIFTHKKNKAVNPDEEDSDFDSYFFEE